MGEGTLGPEHRRLMRLLKEMRSQVGLTQVDLAERLGKSQTEVSKIERGERRVDFLDLTRLLDALGVGLVEFAERWERGRRTARSARSGLKRAHNALDAGRCHAEVRQSFR